MHKHSAVIFDLDGVLIDSVGRNWQAYNQLLGHYGVRINDGQLHDYIGRALQDQVALINQRYRLRLDWRAFQQTTDQIKRQLFDQLQPMPGVLGLLRELKAGSIAWAVGTSSPSETARDRLRRAGLLEYFSVIIAAEDVAAHKPSPDVYLEAARRLRQQPDDCVVIEDAPNGIVAAKRAGMACIALRSRYTRPDDLRAADHIIGSLAEIDVAELLTGRQTEQSTTAAQALA